MYSNSVTKFGIHGYRIAPAKKKKLRQKVAEHCLFLTKVSWCGRGGGGGIKTRTGPLILASAQFWLFCTMVSYRVGSMNYLRRKTGRAHDNSLDWKMLQVHANQMCTRISFFLSKTVREIRAIFLSMTKIQLKRVNHKLSRRTIEAPSAGRFREAPSGPEKSLVQQWLSRKKANFVDSGKLLLRGYKLKKKKKMTVWERELQWPRLRRSTIDRRRRTWAPSAGQSSFFFSFFLRSSNNFRFAFLALKEAIQAFTWKILVCTSRINHVLSCSFSGELATGRPRLRTADRGAASQLPVTEPKEQRVAQRRLRVQARKSELNSSPGPAIPLDMEVERHLVWKPQKRLSWSNVPQKLLTFIDFSIQSSTGLVSYC